MCFDATKELSMNPTTSFINLALEQMEEGASASSIGSWQLDSSHASLSPLAEAYQRLEDAGAQWRDWQTDPSTALEWLDEESRGVYENYYTCNYDQRPDKAYLSALKEFQAALLEYMGGCCDEKAEGNKYYDILKRLDAEMTTAETIVKNNSFLVHCLKYPQIIGCELSIANCFYAGQTYTPPPPPPPVPPRPTPPRKDPLALDLDGDGLETVGINGTRPVMFDHDGDGLRQATGWVSSDDGLLVMDRNGDGIINDGRELFGENTLKNDGSGDTCADAFAALAQEDTNGDGVVDANDANWYDLRVWRDLNQDGISQECELFTMEELGISSISTNKQVVNKDVTGGLQTGQGVFTKTDGTTGQTGQFEFDNNPFYSDYIESWDVPDYMKDLPDFGASGAVRDLLQACLQSGQLRDILEQYSAAGTRAEQTAVLDRLLLAWAGNSGMASSIEVRASGSYNVVNRTFSGAALDEWNRKLHILEAFNGQYFFTLPKDLKPGEKLHYSLVVSGGANGQLPTLTVTYNQTQINLLNQAYEALLDTVLLGLAMQTRLSSVFDLIDVTVAPDTFDMEFDFSQVTAHFVNGMSVNIWESFSDLMDFNRGMNSLMPGKGWNGFDLAHQLIKAWGPNTTLDALYKELQISVHGRPGYSATGTYRSDMIIGGAGNDTLTGLGGNDALYGEGGNDRLFGGDGYDYIRGGEGDDYIEGGECCDQLYGDEGNDTIYGGNGNDKIFGGTGNDKLYGDAGNDTIHGDEGDDLISGGDGNDKLYGDDGNDTLMGDAGNDYLYGGAGSDSLHGGAGEDRLYGGEGNDRLYGDAGNDYLDGEAGDDWLFGGDGDDVLYGGKGGVDYMEGGKGNDVFIFGRGDGYDTVMAYDTTVGKCDRVHLRGLKYSDVEFSISRTLRSGSVYDQNLVITIKATGETLVIQYGFENSMGSAYQVQCFEFGDGTHMTLEEVVEKGVNIGFNSVMNGLDDLKNTLIGNKNNNTIKGGALDDVIYGEGGHDYLYGFGGNDTIYGGLGNDIMYGGQGDDILHGEAGNDTIYGEDGDDTIYGGAGTDKLYGGNGDDYMDGGAGGDTMEGGAGNDTMYGGDGDDKMHGQDGNDFMDGGSGRDIMEGGSGNDILYGGIGDDKLYGGDGNDFLDGGDDKDLLEGGAGNDHLYGGNHDDQLYGGDGDDLLDGGSGNDYLEGGSGNDIFVFGKGYGHDTVNAYDVDSGKNDTVRLSGLLPGDVEFLAAHTPQGNGFDQNLIIRIKSTGETLTIIKGLENTASTILNPVYLIQYFEFGDGTRWSLADMLKNGVTTDGVVISGFNGAENTLIGNSHDNHLVGGNLDDVMYGLDGNDVLQGQDGNDSIYGGAGDDTLYGESGADWLYGESGNDILYGGVGDDWLFGGDGDDILDGGSGNDYLEGGAGNDTFIFGAGSGHDTVMAYDTDAGKCDVVRLNGLSPDDVEFLASHTLRDGAFDQNLVIRIKSTGETMTIMRGLDNNSSSLSNPAYLIQYFEFGDGTRWSMADVVRNGVTTDEVVISGLSQAENTLIGNAHNNHIVGADLDDVIYGHRGNDILQGQDGNDRLFGGAGDDMLYGENGNDVLEGGLGNDFLAGGAGDDTYIFRSGDGQDTIDNWGGGDDRLLLDGLNPAELWFGQSGDNLIINLIGTSDTVTVNNWFGHADYQIDTIEAGGLAITESQVALMIQAMSVIGGPAGVDGGWTEDQRDALQPVLATYWKQAV
ncbi:hypothetical protein C4J81_02255 [Deltaproteobacteria bacterium Smac51]|nr:hypothetical protein C4J81_02255 [Deltaproteobacteria bacterium Smac51]